MYVFLILSLHSYIFSSWYPSILCLRTSIFPWFFLYYSLLFDIFHFSLTLFLFSSPSYLVYLISVNFLIIFLQNDVKLAHLFSSGLFLRCTKRIHWRLLVSNFFANSIKTFGSKILMNAVAENHSKARATSVPSIFPGIPDCFSWC